MSCCTAFGSDFHTNGASAFMMSLKMVYVLAFTAGARTSAKSCGTILPNISATSISFVVIKSVRMPAIFPALLGMIPCHPPRSPNGDPTFLARHLMFLHNANIVQLMKKDDMLDMLSKSITPKTRVIIFDLVRAAEHGDLTGMYEMIKD